MAILRDMASGATLPLPSRVVVGRAPTAGIRLTDARVSGEHATIVWTGTRWEVRDLGSRNGTFVSGLRIEPGAPHWLRVGQKLSFGQPAPAFEFVMSSPPGPIGRDLRSGQWIPGDGALLVLPSAEKPEVSVFAEPNGSWWMESGDDRRPVADGEVVDAGGERFVLALPASFEGTATVDGMSLQTIGLRFRVSLDEEHVRLWLVHRGVEIPLERSETWYVLLTFARKRKEEEALPLAEQGWMDRDGLLRLHRLDPNALNVAIYRMRGRLAAAGVEDPVGMVEVRRAQRRIGIPPERIEILRVSDWWF